MSSDALKFSRLASNLWRHIQMIQKETLTGEDYSAEAIDSILSSFTEIENLVEQRYKKVKSEVEELPDQ